VAGRSGLNRELIAETAEALVDREGWQQLSMTALARKLGVRGPSLYNHVDSLDALLADVQARALAELSGRLQRAAMGRSGAQALRALAAVLRAFAAEHPGRYDLAMSEAIDRVRMAAAGEPAQAALTAVIESFDIAEPAMDLLQTCLAPLHGVIALDRSHLFAGLTDTSVVYERAVDLVILMLENRNTEKGTAT
jgi:AcrR family transcriptional regulator